MTESWYIVVDHTVCPYNKGGKCRPYGFGNPHECCRENCIMCIIEKKDLLKNGEREIKMTDTIDKKELILKIIPLKKNIEECAEEVDGPHWRAYKSSYYRGYLDAISDIVNKIYE